MDEYNDDDEEGENQEPQGNATLLNDFSIFEYFEPYRNQSIIDEGNLNAFLLNPHFISI